MPLPFEELSMLMVDTSTQACVIAVQHQGRIYEQCVVGNNLHSQVIFGQIHTVMDSAQIFLDDLDLIAIGEGPGSFAGLRIGIGVAIGLAYAHQKPVLALSSLRCLAASLDNTSNARVIMPAIDARMNEIYWGVYHVQDLRVAESVQVSTPQEVVQRMHQYPSIIACGNAWEVYRQQLAHGSWVGTDVCYPSAKGMKVAARYHYEQQGVITAIQFTPCYIRDKVAQATSGS